MAVGGCHKEYVEVCEIIACAPGRANPDLYTRLRFGLLASSWLPSPLGIVLWRAVHVVMLVVGGPAFWALVLVTTFLYCSVFMFSLVAIMFGIYFGLLAVFSVAVDLVLFLARSIRFCWLVVGFPACHASIGNWKGAPGYTLILWGNWKEMMTTILAGTVPRGVPCMRGSLYREFNDRIWETWARWWEEVVHSHEAIAL